MALRADVFGRIAAADDEQVLAGKFHGVAKIVGVEDAAGEIIQTFEKQV